VADAEDRTQPASERRLQQARDAGQTPLSRELVACAGLSAAALMLSLAMPSIVRSLTARLTAMLTITATSPGDALARGMQAWSSSVLLFSGACGLAGAGAVLLQTNFLFRREALTPDFARLNPMRGLTRVFSASNLVETAKALAKLAILAWAFWRSMVTAWPGLNESLLWTPTTFVDRLTRELLHLLLLVLAAQVLIAILDRGWMQFKFARQVRMSRVEMKEEAREAEGDPKIKARLRQLRLMRAKRRMMAAVGKATVVITNPTHYAVALSYERGTQMAPRVVAKGMDDVAARIREAAYKAGVPLVANPPLARALYGVALDAEVPAEHFRTVAEIIAYVWRLKEQVGTPR